MQHFVGPFALVLLLAVAATSQEVQTVHSARTFWKHNPSCSSCSGAYYPAAACGILGCASCSVYGRYWGAQAAAMVPAGAGAAQSCGCAVCDTANGYQLLPDGSCGCMAGYGSHVMPTSSSACSVCGSSTTRSQAPVCPSWGGYYYPYRPTRRYYWSHKYAGGRSMSYYSSCMCRACPAGYTSQGGPITSTGCYLSSPIPQPPPPPPPPVASPAPTPSPDPPIPPESPNPDSPAPYVPDYSPAPYTPEPYTPEPSPAPATARSTGRTRIQNTIISQAANGAFASAAKGLGH